MRTIAREKSLTEKVADSLRLSIINGELKMGMSLSESSLSETFGVSKTPVREALFILKQEGLIDIIPQKGSFVFNANEESIEKLCDYRSFIEPIALAESIVKNNDELAEELEVLMVKMKRKLKNNELKDFLLLDGKFHHAFFKYCENPYLQKSYDLVQYHIGAIRNHLSTIESASNSIMSDHQEIVDAVNNKDIITAQTIVKKHVLDIKDLFKNFIKQ